MQSAISKAENRYSRMTHKSPVSIGQELNTVEKMHAQQKTNLTRKLINSFNCPVKMMQQCKHNGEI